MGGVGRSGVGQSPKGETIAKPIGCRFLPPSKIRRMFFSGTAGRRELLASHEAMGSAPLVPFVSLVTWRFALGDADSTHERMLASVRPWHAHLLVLVTRALVEGKTWKGPVPACQWVHRPRLEGARGWMGTWEEAVHEWL
jgi:hypothetical protein